MATTAADHGVNVGALEEFLGLKFPKGGRTVLMQVAAADADGRIPSAVPRYDASGPSTLNTFQPGEARLHLCVLCDVPDLRLKCVRLVPSEVWRYNACHAARACLSN